MDTLWLGAWVPGARADLIAACEAAGIAVIGPDAETVRRLSDRQQLASLHASLDAGQHARGEPLPAGAATRRAEIDIVADDHGTVWMLGIRDVSLCQGGSALLCELPASDLADELAADMARAATGLARQAGYRGAGVVGFVHDGRRFAVTGFDTAAAPLMPAPKSAPASASSAGACASTRVKRCPRPSRPPRPSPSRPGCWPRTPTPAAWPRPGGLPCCRSRSAPACASTPAAASATGSRRPIRCSPSSPPAAPIGAGRWSACAGPWNAPRW